MAFKREVKQLPYPLFYDGELCADVVVKRCACHAVLSTELSVRIRNAVSPQRMYKLEEDKLGNKSSADLPPVMQHRSKHSLERSRILKQDRVCIQLYHTLSFTQVKSVAPRNV